MEECDEKSVCASIRKKLHHKNKHHKIVEGMDIVQKPFLLFTPLPNTKSEVEDEDFSLKKMCTEQRMKFNRYLEDELNNLVALRQKFVFRGDNEEVYSENN